MDIIHNLKLLHKFMHKKEVNRNLLMILLKYGIKLWCLVDMILPNGINNIMGYKYKNKYVYKYENLRLII